MAMIERGTDPHELADAVTRAGLFQDIVVAATQVLHRLALDTAQQKVLQQCRDLLLVAASPTVRFPVSGIQQLANSPETLAFLRVARPGASADEPSQPTDGSFERLAKAISSAIKGDRSDDVIHAMDDLRRIFLLVGQLDLDASLKNEQERSASSSWTPSTVSLSS